MAGVHSEGGVWATLWGLLMWDALFADVADSLRTPFQTCPLDLSSPTFYTVRPRHTHIHLCVQSLLLLFTSHALVGTKLNSSWAKFQS